MTNSFELQIDEKMFNSIWRGLCMREQYLLDEINEAGDESDEIGVLNNDLSVIRGYKDHLSNKASKSNFPSTVYSLTEEIIDLNDF